MKRSLAGTSAIAAVVVGLGVTPASAEIPVPPDNSVQVYNLKTTCQVIDSFATVSSNPTIRWSKAPKRKGLTVGHYMRVKTQIMTSAGINGTLWKPLAGKTHKTDTYYLPSKGLPITFQAPVSYNARYGTLDYRTRVTVRVIRNVTLGVDTTAWKGYYWDTFPALCTGRGGA